MLAPLLAVMLFLAAIVAAFAYLRLEEIDREHEAVRRDVEYTQQRLRLRVANALLQRLVRLLKNLLRQTKDRQQTPRGCIAHAGG